jgi:Lon protease-like protein
MVLFPGHMAPMNIRYPDQRAMLAEAIDGGGRLGILFRPDLRSQDSFVQLAPVGTVALVTDVREPRPGRVFFNATGEFRFRTLRVLQEQPYLRLEAEPLAEPVGEVPASLVDAVRQALFDYYEAKSGLTGGWLHEWASSADGATLSYIVGRYMEAVPSVKQVLLEIPGHAERLEKELEVLAAETELLRQAPRRRPTLPGMPSLN